MYLLLLSYLKTVKESNEHDFNYTTNKSELHLKSVSRFNFESMLIKIRSWSVILSLRKLFKLSFIQCNSHSQQKNTGAEKEAKSYRRLEINNKAKWKKPTALDASSLPSALQRESGQGNVSLRSRGFQADFKNNIKLKRNEIFIRSPNQQMCH